MTLNFLYNQRLNTNVNTRAGSNIVIAITSNKQLDLHAPLLYPQLTPTAYKLYRVRVQ